MTMGPTPLKPLALCLVLVMSFGCGGAGSAPTKEPGNAMTMDAPPLADIAPSEWEALASRRIFFGHQSVGRDLVQGVERVLQDHPEIGIAVVSSEHPNQVDGPAFIEARIGRNSEPETKADAFAEILKDGFGHEPGAAAMYKYCYVDIQPDTDPDRLFEDYVDHTERLRGLYPELLIIHITLPLRAAPTGLKERVKTRLGRSTETALNGKRNRYNERLREHYQGTDPIFDLALIQSTRADGTRAYTRYRGQNVYMLAPEWTYDGGHLNDEAKYRMAERLLVFLARLPRVSDHVKMVAAGGATNR